MVARYNADGWCVGRYRLASRSYQGGARYASVTCVTCVTCVSTQYGRLEESARRARDERLAFQMDQLPERLPTEMVRPVKWPPVVLQVVSYVSSDLSTSSTLNPSLADRERALLVASSSYLRSLLRRDRSLDVVIVVVIIAVAPRSRHAISFVLLTRFHLHGEKKK